MIATAVDGIFFSIVFGPMCLGIALGAISIGIALIRYGLLSCAKAWRGEPLE